MALLPVKSSTNQARSRMFHVKHKFLVGTGRFELPTCRLGGGRSIHLSYVPIWSANSSLPTSKAFLADIVAVMHSFKPNLF